MRQTERQLLDLGSAIENWAQDAKELLHQETHLCEAQRERLRRDDAKADRTDPPADHGSSLMLRPRLE